MEIDMSEYLDEFAKETSEHIEIIEDLLVKLDKNKKDMNAINEIFRAAHSLKGMAASMDFKRMETLTHRAEDILYAVREKGLEVNNKILKNLMVAFEYVGELLESIENTGSEDDVEVDKIDKLVLSFDKIIGKTIEEKSVEVTKLELSDEELAFVEKRIENGEKVYQVAVFISSNSPLKSVRVFMVLNNLSNCGEIIKSSPDIKKFKEKEYEYNNSEVCAILSTKQTKDEIDEIVARISEIEFVHTKDIKTKEDLDFSLEFESKEPKVEGKIEEKEYIDICEFASEINYKLDEIELHIVGIGEFADSNTELVEISESFKDIFDLIELSDLENLTKMLNLTKELIELSINSKFNIEIEDVEYVLDSINLLKKACISDTDRKKKILSKKVNEHIKALNLVLKDNKMGSEAGIGEILLEKSNLKRSDIDDLLKKQKEDYPNLKLGELAVKEKKASSKEVLGAIKLQKKIRDEKKHFVKSEEIRIPALKADNLIDMLEELRIVQSQIEQEVMKNYKAESGLVRNLFRAFRITKEIQNLSISFRMVSLHQTFQKIKLSIRDTIKKLDKKIDFKITGERTEIDRMLASRILDPLLHLVKNCVSHGVEDADERKSVGKSEKGNISLTAYTQKGYVYIEIADDGKGINRDIIYKKAEEKKIIDKNKKYTDEDIIDFIFLPGFSTNDVVDKISGRGVGMDVVKTELTKLGGKIMIETEIGKGTKFTLRIPKNMTALNGTVVSIDDAKYIIPTNYIKEIFKLEESKFITIKGEKKMVRLRDSIIPIIPSNVMGIHPKEENIMVVLEVDNKYKAMAVKDIVERRELVVKPLGDEFEDIGFIFGASILGDGKAALILDIERMFLSEEKKVN